MADLLGHFPREMVVEIVAWVPAGSLLKLKHVSKPWHALISELVDDPAFVSLHLSHAKNQNSTSVLFLHRCDGQPELVGEQHSLVTILHSDRFAGHSYPSVSQGIDLNAVFRGRGRWHYTFHCDGIVCVVRNICTMCIFNLALRECRMVSRPTDIPSVQGIGFGYDARAKDYKLVRIFPTCFGKQPEVYSLNDDSWKVIQMPENMRAISIVHFKGLYAKGVCYWSVFGVADLPDAVLCFDMSDEEFSLMNFPEGDTSPLLTTETHYILWDNSLSVIICYRDGESDVLPKFIDVHMLDGHSVKDKSGPCWTKQRLAGPPKSLAKAFWCLGNNELVMKDDGRKLVAYNLHSQKFRDIVVQDYKKLQQAVYLYIESLVSVKKRRSNKKNNFGENPCVIGDLSRMSLTGSE